MEVIIGGKYKLGKKIGSGYFGDIYVGTEIATNQQVAIKLEAKESKYPQLLFESKLYRMLQGGPGIPKFYWFGQEADFNIMIIDLLGPSLEDLFNFCGKKFPLKTVLMIIDQIIESIQFMHQNNFLHRDIKPQNFLVGSGKKSDQIFMIDYGLAKKFRDPRTGLHIPYQENRDLSGTQRFSSINTHLGIEQSRRDDLVSIGFMVLYFLNGTLPWMGIKCQTKEEKYELIKNKKISTPVKEMCGNIPEEFYTYIDYVRALKFEEKPDYIMIQRLFKDLFFKEKNAEWNLIFEWALISSNKKKEDKVKENQLKEIEQQ